MAVVRSLAQLATLVRSRRTALGLTQAALAQRAGVSRWWVTEFESGRARAELALTLQLLDALDLAIDVNPREVGDDAARERGEHLDLDAHLAAWGMPPDEVRARVRELADRAADAFSTAAAAPAVGELDGHLPARLTDLVAERAVRCRAIVT